MIILTAIANRFRLHKLDKVEKFVMAYGGLRGAVAFALVLLIDEKVVPLKKMFVTYLLYNDLSTPLFSFVVNGNAAVVTGDNEQLNLECLFFFFFRSSVTHPSPSLCSRFVTTTIAVIYFTVFVQVNTYRTRTRQTLLFYTYRANK